VNEENRQIYYYHGDHLGSVQLVTDYQGKTYEQLEYTPYGELWVEHVPITWETPFRFTGKERDGETGLYYYGARYLNPQTSMWLSADPAMGEYVPLAPIDGEAKQHNKELPGLGGVFNYVNLHAYHYAGNNPVVLIDPDGSIIVTSILLYRQSDSRFSGEFLGSKKTYDDGDGTKPNSIGAYGCFYMAAASVGLSLSGRYSRSVRDRSSDVLRYNLENNFMFTGNERGGTDVNLKSLRACSHYVESMNTRR
jgi:RHS repeat-associated protein